MKKIIKDDIKFIHAKPIIYIDMDNVIVDFQSGINSLSAKLKKKYKHKYDVCPHIFSSMEPLGNSIETIKKLYDTKKYELYILSTSPWNNPTALQDKLEWINKYFEKIFYKKIIFTHHKELVGTKSDFLIDDRDKNGAKFFKGKLIRFGSRKFPNWNSIQNLLIQ